MKNLQSMLLLLAAKTDTTDGASRMPLGRDTNAHKHKKKLAGRLICLVESGRHVAQALERTLENFGSDAFFVLPLSEQISSCCTRLNIREKIPQPLVAGARGSATGAESGGGYGFKLYNNTGRMLQMSLGDNLDVLRVVASVMPSVLGRAGGKKGKECILMELARSEASMAKHTGQVQVMRSRACRCWCLPVR